MVLIGSDRLGVFGEDRKDEDALGDKPLEGGEDLMRDPLPLERRIDHEAVEGEDHVALFGVDLLQENGEFARASRRGEETARQIVVAGDVGEDPALFLDEVGVFMAKIVREIAFVRIALAPGAVPFLLHRLLDALKEKEDLL